MVGKSKQNDFSFYTKIIIQELLFDSVVDYFLRSPRPFKGNGLKPNQHNFFTNVMRPFVWSSHIHNTPLQMRANSLFLFAFSVQLFSLDNYKL